MRPTLLSLIFVLLPLAAMAQEEGADDKLPRINKLQLETRMGFEGIHDDGQLNNDRTGFKGQFINLRFDGRIYGGLTVSWRQRLNKPSERTFWDATDWLHVDYAFTPKWSVSAGKQIVWIGGYEYDRPPIDLYYCSEYWYHIPCYQLGASGTFTPNDRHQLTLQLTNSPFRQTAGNNTYALNAIWYGHVGLWHPIWSLNMFEYERGKWINYIALGNRFVFSPQWSLEADYINRASSHQTFLFRDMTVSAELSYAPHKAVRAFAKYNYDVNKTSSDADLLVVKGVKMQSASVGLEAMPIRNYRDGIKLFASAGYSWGTNPATDGELQDNQWRFQAGVKWRLDVLEAVGRFFRKAKEKR